jgi:hypothetical protein
MKRLSRKDSLDPNGYLKRTKAGGTIHEVFLKRAGTLATPIAASSPEDVLYKSTVGV